jgi:hypothetical protein
MLEYSYKVTAARVVAQGELENVIREVDVIVRGVDGAASFELPTSVKLGEADEESFTPFEQLTEEQITGWLQSDQTLEGVRSHIALVINRELARLEMEQKPLPWAPMPSPGSLPEPVASGD